MRVQCSCSSSRTRAGGRGRPAGAVFGDVDDFDFAAGRLPGPFPAFGLLVALPAHFIRVPAIVAHELEVFAGNMLSDGGDQPTEGRQPARTCRRERSERQLAGGEDLKVALDLRIPAGAVDDGAAVGIGMHLFDGEGVADNVLRKPLKIFALTAVDVEAGVFPVALLVSYIWDKMPDDSGRRPVRSSTFP